MSAARRAISARMCAGLAQNAGSGAIDIGLKLVVSAEKTLGRTYDRGGPGHPGGMLAFILKKFAGSYFALSAVRRVHWWSV
jgi:hypothetical protein